MGNVERIAAKVLLVTPELDVLLFSSLDPGDPGRARYWFAVGGGVEDGETLEEAAVREAYEETGLELTDLGSPLFIRHATFDFEDDHYEQDETYFVAWVDRFTPRTDGWTELERRATAEHRWWSVEELASTDSIVYPEQLAELLWSLRGRDPASAAATRRVEQGGLEEMLASSAVAVRPARSEDSRTIQFIERRAGERFREIGLPDIADDDPEPVATLDRFAAAGRSFVAFDEPDHVLGYVLVEKIDDTAFIHQVSVLPEQQGRGIGRQLLDAVDGWACEQGLSAVTLTTFDRHVPWNRPLYEHLGFRLLEANEVGRELRAVQAAEAAKGFQQRVAMLRQVAAFNA